MPSKKTTKPRSTKPRPKKAITKGKGSKTPFDASIWAMPFLEQLSSGLPFVVWTWDIESDNVLFPPRWRSVLMQPHDFPLCTPAEEWIRNVHEEDVASIRQSNEEVLQGKRDRVELAFRLQRGDGTWIWLLSQGTVTERTPEGKPRLIKGICVNVSMLRSNPRFQQRAAGTGESWYHTMLENSPDAIGRLDKNLFPLYVNPAAARQLGRNNNQDVTGSDSVEGVGLRPDWVAYLQKKVDQVVEQKISIKERVEYSNLDGHKFAGEYSFWPEIGPDGTVISIMSQFRDMTEQIKAEKQLRLNEMRLSAQYRLSQMDHATEDEILDFVLSSISTLTNSTGAFFFIPDNGLEGKGRLHLAKAADLSPAVLSAIKKDRLPSDILTCLRDDDDEALLSRGIRNGDGKTPMFSLLPNGQAPQVFRYAVASVKEGDRIVCMAGVRNKPTDYDESDLQQVETFIKGAWILLSRVQHTRELEQAKAAAEAARNAMSEFLANVNHELRTPLTSILGYAETMVSLGPDENEARLRCLAVIQRHAEQMHVLVEKLLTLHRAENAILPLELNMLYLSDLAQSIADLMRREAEEKNLKVVVRVPKNLQVQADTLFISQVFRNLLENAFRYAEPGTEVTISGHREGKEAVISVRDHGPGIESNDLEHLFERFFRGKQAKVNNGKPPRHKNLGLGLPICKNVVERHNGRIWAENTPPGATISFALPVTQKG